MKGVLKTKQRIVILALAFLPLLAGCGMVNVDPRGYDGAPRYAATDPEGVEILRAAPDKAVVIITPRRFQAEHQRAVL